MEYEYAPYGDGYVKRAKGSADDWEPVPAEDNDIVAKVLQDEKEAGWAALRIPRPRIIRARERAEG